MLLGDTDTYNPLLNVREPLVGLVVVPIMMMMMMMISPYLSCAVHLSARCSASKHIFDNCIVTGTSSVIVITFSN